MIHQNPFLSNTFTKVWEAHFNNKKASVTFDFINDITFVRSKLPNVFINTGKNLTKGISYNLSQELTANNFRKKNLLIFDVPQHFDVQTKTNLKGLKVKKIKQYPGFLINQENHTNFNDYLNKTFSKSSVQKFNRYKKRLESCFNIKEKMLIGNIEKAEYDSVFNHFKALLTKRFDEKQIVNNNLNPEEWEFYHAVAYPMILEKKAALHVIYNEETPISVRLLYFSEAIIFDAITVFDIDYSKFHIGKIAIMKMLEWSFKSDYKIFDFSKGYFDYKESWSDLKYDFEYHIYYDSTSIASNFMATTLASFFKLKQYLREKELNNKLHKLSFFIKKKQSKNTQTNVVTVDEKTIDSTDAVLNKINIHNKEYAYLKKQVYDFLFLNSEHVNDTDVFKINNVKNQQLFLIKGKNNKLILSFSHFDSMKHQ